MAEKQLTDAEKIHEIYENLLGTVKNGGGKIGLIGRVCNLESHQKLVWGVLVLMCVGIIIKSFWGG